MLELTKGDTPLVFPKFPNEDKMTESEICCKCTGCCRYVSVDIKKPRSKDTIDLYVWYLLHKNVQIYIDNDKGWNLLFITTCTKLQSDGKCGIYPTRPKLCKDYSPSGCSRTGKDHTHLFMTPDALLNYLEEEKAKKGKKKQLKR
ncbi:MAG TPA: YkgJ family cysteine cluster protein [Leptospiraceae bacterium]|nr:YkgJ family cysteine cluster protein [Leptospiraceae bacterium]HMW05142.1 YkgJ family cysteine cluster protein [Leptospiraceae bacterium]HMX32597.1 YkgJ family cysteine cluster protein [Leptospiraceae bacterium]HMY32481.1 YkgJ family cysteine cluster protein [Leptospiraceae bacterium]HMZ66621.1 YkgJ family cysteine cluster protein [Leptospiraceae bacterium]